MSNATPKHPTPTPTPTQYAAQVATTAMPGTMFKFRDVERACGLDINAFNGPHSDWGPQSVALRLEFVEALRQRRVFVKSDTKRGAYVVVDSNAAVAGACRNGTAKRHRAAKRLIEQLEAVPDAQLDAAHRARKERKLAHLHNAVRHGPGQHVYGRGVPPLSPLAPKWSG